MELTTSYAPLSGLRLQYTAAYTQAVFTELDPNGCCMLTGYQLPNVPKWGMSIDADYAWALSSTWHAHVGGAARWVDRRWASSPESLSSGFAFPAVVLPSYSVLDLFTDVAKGRYKVRAFAMNVANTRAYLSGGVIGNNLSNLYQFNYVLLRPRTFGIGLDYTF
jgi:iron complex outermembrane receptor protein